MRKFRWPAVLAAVMLLALAAVGGWYVLLRDDAPEQVSLESAVAAAGTAGTPVAGELRGTWSIAAGGTSIVGYRVREELARIGGATAVGRTSAVSGQLVYDGSAITDVQVTADLSALRSDNGLRDGALRMQALETGKFPSATFRLTQPIAIRDAPTEGMRISVEAVGDLTLHGVTRQVSIPLEGQLTGGQVVIAGSLDIRFADYGIAQPRAAAVLSVEDHGLLEIQLIFERAAPQR